MENLVVGIQYGAEARYAVIKIPCTSVYDCPDLTRCMCEDTLCKCKREGRLRFITQASSPHPRAEKEIP